MNKFSRFVEKWWSRIFMLAFIAFAAWLLVLLTSCSTSRTVENRTVKDSVVYAYKTLYRDSVRIKDSVRVMTRTVTRDSVVLRVDSETGKILSKDSWHWNDTNTDRDHIRDNTQKTDKEDSVARTELKKNSTMIIHQNDNKATETRKIAPAFKQKVKYVLSGVVIGILLSLGFKYRKQVMAIIRKLVIMI
ncbi:MAG: hypothetical protein LKE41_00945 [Prevotella sp.]|jgi:hypothetical protein|nr:hypothetical protein [Prevotella sp.]